MVNFKEIEAWFLTQVGAKLLLAEQAVLNSLLESLFGYHLLVLSVPEICHSLNGSKITNKICLYPPHAQPRSGVSSLLMSQLDTLPLRPDSVDVVVVVHILEFIDDPHALLRELYRILIPEGHLILIGFNPISLWGLWRVFHRCQGIPWAGKFYRISRVKDWLNLLGFQIKQQKSCFLGAPVHFGSNTERPPYGVLSLRGGAYILSAQKRLSTLTPIQPRWLTKRYFVGPRWSVTTSHTMETPIED